MSSESLNPFSYENTIRALRTHIRIRKVLQEIKILEGREKEPLSVAELRLSQLAAKLDSRPLAEALMKLRISPEHTSARPLVVFAGYNAKTALALKRAGYNVVFTDIEPQWVDRAKRKGLPAFAANAKTLHRKFKPNSVTAFVSYQPFFMVPPIGGRDKEALLNLVNSARRGVIILDHNRPSNRYSKAFQRYIQKPRFLARHGLKVREVVVRDSKTIEGGQLSLFHISKESANRQGEAHGDSTPTKRKMKK